MANKTANTQEREWMVMNATRKPVEGVGDKHKVEKFNDRGFFTTKDQGFVRGLEDRFGHGEDSPVVIADVTGRRPREVGDPRVHTVPPLPWKVNDGD